MRRRVLAWIVVLLAMLGIAGGLGFYKLNEIQAGMAAGAARPEPVESVVIARATSGAWAPTTRAIGTVVAFQQLELRNEIAGLVAERGFASGEIVEKGQVLIQLDDREEKAALSAAEAERRLAKTVLDRRAGLRDSAAFSSLEFDKSREELAAATARAERLKVAIDKKRMTAPFKARIGISDLQPGAYLESGTMIVRLQGVDDDVYIDFSLPQENAALLAPGRVVSITSPALPEGPREITIQAVDDSVDPANRTVRFRAVGKGLGHVLRPGAFVDVVAATAKPVSRVLIPLSAVRRSPNGQHVFVIDTEDGKSRARERPVETGAMVGELVIVEKGLKAGELIATAGSFKLRDGLLVAVEAAAATAAPAVVN